MRVQRGAAAAIGLAGILALAGIAAGAQGKLGAVKKTVAFEAGVGDAKAKCRNGRNAIAGGFAVSGLGDDFAYFVRSAPAGRKSWRAAVLELSALDDSARMKTYAYCRDQAVRTRLGENPGHKEGVVRARAKCPGGKVAVSGGVASKYAAGPEPLPFGTRRAGPKAWKVIANNFGDDPSDPPLVAAVKCASGDPPRQVKKSTNISGGGDRLAKAKARCRAAERVVSGGFTAKPPLGKGVSMVNTSRRAGPGAWLVKMRSIAPGKLTAFAYCEDR